MRPWFDALDALKKEWVSFPRPGHKPFVEEADAFRAQLLTIPV